jgi:hypothetical protein
MSEEQHLVPRALREIDFYHDKLMIALVDNEAYVALRPITEYLGLDWSAQRQRLCVMRCSLRSQQLQTHQTRSVSGCPRVS